MNIQKSFAHNVRLFFKRKGELWLQQLPDLIAYCEEKWGLKIKEPYTLSVNYVAEATMLDGEDVVVKICIPGPGFLDELESLRLFKGDGMVRILDFDRDKGMMLLEKLSPGNTLADDTDDTMACRRAINVVKKLSIPAPLKTRIPTTQSREENLRKLLDDQQGDLGPITRGTIEEAFRVFTYLNQTTEQNFLLHGDFHHYNILASGDDEWKAIDPKGLIGEIEYDLIQFLLNNLPDNRAYEVIQERVDIFTDELELDTERLLLWGFAHAVLATSWSVDESGGYETKFYQGIEIFKKMYSANFTSEISDLIL